MLSLLISCGYKPNLRPITIQHQSFINLLDGDDVSIGETEVSMSFDKNGIHLKALLYEENIRAAVVTRDDWIYTEPCIEFFLDPGGDGLNYYELEINAIGTICDLQLVDALGPINDADNMIPWNITPDHVDIQIDGSLNDENKDTSWQFELTIPWTDFTEGIPVKGDRWRYNIMRINYSDSDPTYWVVKPTSKGMIHVPDTWPEIHF